MALLWCGGCRLPRRTYSARLLHIFPTNGNLRELIDSQGSEMSEVNFTFRVDSKLKERFVQAAKKYDRNASLLLRDFMRQYVSNNDDAPGAARPKKTAAKTNA